MVYCRCKAIVNAEDIGWRELEPEGSLFYNVAWPLVIKGPFSRVYADMD